ncbi:MAG: helix-turn-helix transcriptional regulator [Ruminococcaceae bacterium]|nr:helix-turn-helix transcriptional regulator [Oscillospiraceae bacterium]
MEEIKLIIAHNIAELRKQNGLTQIELAEKLNYSDKSVSKWERGESIPDIVVLKEIADLFGVTVDYLITKDHPIKTTIKEAIKGKIRNRGFITGMSIICVWLIATLIFVLVDITIGDIKLHWLSFIYAVPVSMVVWLIFNSIWFNKRRNFLIVSFLMWSSLATIYISLLPFSINFWKLFILGVPAQVIIYLWSNLKYKSNDKKS